MDQAINESLQTAPDYFFWLFPQNLSLNKLLSQAKNHFQFAKVKTGLSFSFKRIENELDISFASENINFTSSLRSNRLTDDSSATPFINDVRFRNNALSLFYTGKIKLSERSLFSLRLVNEPNFIYYQSEGNLLSHETKFLYDYSVGISSKGRTSDFGITFGLRKQLLDNNLYFPNFTQTGFHRLQSGYMTPYDTKSTYFQISHSLISVKRQLIMSFLFNWSHNNDLYIRNLTTKNISTIYSILYHPNSSNSFFTFFNAQKAIGNLPLYLNSKIFYNWRTLYSRVNDEIIKSHFQYFNGTLGLKSNFKWLINFDYSFSYYTTKNRVLSSAGSDSHTESVVNKANIFIVQKDLFNTTISWYNISSNSGSGFSGNYIDVSFSKKLLKEKLIIEFNARNLFNKDRISSESVTPFYKQENTNWLRGREFVIKIKYEIK